MPPNGVPVVTSAGRKRPIPKSRATTTASRPAKKSKESIPTYANETVSGSPSTTHNPPNEVAVAGLPKEEDDVLRERFIALFAPGRSYADEGISNSQLKSLFDAAEYTKLVPIINQLSSESRLTMSRIGENELSYKLVPEEVASKFAGLDASHRLVYQSIQRSGVHGAWTKDIRRETNIQNQALNKIFKTLEARRLIKPVKSVNAKAKKLYMLYDLVPSTDLTGGVWYSDLEFDHEFISELRGFILHCLRRMNNGQGCTLKEILDRMAQGKISRVTLGLDNVFQLMRTLMFDHLVEETETEDGGRIYTASRRVTASSEFKWWTDALSSDFHFRTVKFEDGIVLEPHEQHYHTA